MQPFPDLKVYFDDLLEKHGTVIYKWTLEGTNTGPGGTGKRVRISGFEEWRMDADCLVANRLATSTPPRIERQVLHGVDGK